MPALSWHSFFMYSGDLIDNRILLANLEQILAILRNLLAKLQHILAIPKHLLAKRSPIKRITFPSLKKLLFYLLLNDHHLHLDESHRFLPQKWTVNVAPV